MALKYRFDTLGWYNFENLVQSLLKELIGNGVSSFGGTKDKGREATFHGKAPFPSKEECWEGNWVFQVKYSDTDKLRCGSHGNRFIRTTINDLESINERNFIQYDIYILITSFELTSMLKDKLYAAVSNSSYRCKFHLIDGKDTCHLLDNHPNIRRSYPQLIALSDLNSIINHSIYIKSEAFLEHWQNELKTFVAVRQYYKAMNTIKNHDFVVLSGPPESGKTTIGAAIALYYVSEGYAAYFINNSEDFFKVYNISEKQIFFADDAIGSVSYDPSTCDRWCADLDGILIKLNPQHRLIWTVRSYILKAALYESKMDESVQGFPGQREVIVEIGELDKLEKALILYNHVKQNNYNTRLKQVIIKLCKYICCHSNYTPEKIRVLVDVILARYHNVIEEIEREECESEIREYMNQPEKRFMRAYRQLGKSEKTLLTALLDLGRAVRREELKKEYERRISSI